jgi:hypothetical protein
MGRNVKGNSAFLWKLFWLGTKQCEGIEDRFHLCHTRFIKTFAFRFLFSNRKIQIAWTILHCTAEKNL